MSKISELGPITGANTRTEDLFVIVNLVQGDDGTKNITRRELVEAIQYEEFSRIRITGGTIANVVMSNSTLNNVTINTSDFIAGDIDRSVIARSDFNDGDIARSTFDDGQLTNSTGANLQITDSVFDQGELTNSTGDNLNITASVLDQSNVTSSYITDSTFDAGDVINSNANNLLITSSDFSNGTGNNDVFTNSRIDDSFFNNPTIEGGVANGTILTNVQIDGLSLEDVTISNSEIYDTNFANGAITNANIGESIFTAGEITNSNANNIIITDSEFNDGTGNNVTLTNSTIDNSLIQNSVIANTEFQGGLENVTINDAIITSSSASNTGITESTFQGRIEDSTIANSVIEDLDLDNVVIRNSKLLDSEIKDFDMELTKQWEPNMDEDNYFAIKNVKTDETEKISYRQFFDEIARKTEKALKVHVAIDGDDDAPGTILQPVGTLERAAELALEKAGGSYNRNGLNDPVHISVGPGTHYTKGNIKLPDDCSITSTSGQYATVVQALPGYETENCFLLGSGGYAQGFSFFNWRVDNFDFPEGGFAYAYRPGAKILRSPYVRDSSQLSNFNRLDVEPPLQPFNSKGTVADLGQEVILEVGHAGEFNEGDEVTFSNGAYGYLSWDDAADIAKGLPGDLATINKIFVRNLKGTVEVGDYVYSQSGGTGQVNALGIDDFPNPLVGRGGGVILADRRQLDTDSLYTYFLAFGATPRTQNGIGYVARDGAGVNGIGSLSIFVRVAFYALNGGQMTLNNSGTQFGDISMRAKGSTTIFAPQDTTANLIGNTDFADSIENRATDIIEDMVDYLTANTANGGLGLQEYDSDKCKRDTGIIIDSVGYDVALNTNYWGRLNGLTYRSPISQRVYGEQLNETAGSIRHLKDEVDYLFRNSDVSVLERANTSFNATLDILENGEDYAAPLTFEDTGVVARTAARKLLMDNTDHITEKFIDWIEDNDQFYAYDSNKCRRDIKDYILPAAKYDMLLDTNYNAVTAGNAYYMNTARKVIGEQRNETVSAYQRLRTQTADLLSANSSAGEVGASDSINEIVDILNNAGRKYTPVDATYNPVTGSMTVTIGFHDLTVGTRIVIDPGSMIFTCEDDGFVTELAHPRPTDKVAYQRPLPITAVTVTGFTVFVGTSTNFRHKFERSTKKCISVVGSAITYSNDASIPAVNRNARKQLQANRSYIQNYMLDWIDDNYFLYDSDKCRRDTIEYILPAVERDMLLGTNFNSIQSGVAYYTATASEVVGSQLTQTAGAIRHLKDQVANTVLTDAESIERVNNAFNEVVSIMENAGRLYTPLGATYDPTTGIMEVTIGTHDLQVGQQILIADESMTWECGSPAVQITHPRPSDPAYRTPQTIVEVTNTTITMNVGDAGGYTGAHTLVSADADSFKLATYTGSYTPRTAAYDPVNGEMVITIGRHNLKRGDWVQFKPGSITFSCLDANSNPVTITHPRPTEGPYQTPIRIHDIDGSTIKVYVGNAGGYTGTHTFVSADTGAVNVDAIYWSDPAKVIETHTPTNGTYDPVTGVTTLEIGTHAIETGDFVEIAPYGLTWSCGSPTEYISNPRVGEPNYGVPIEITSTTATGITFNSGAAGYSGAHTFESASAGSVIHTQATKGGVLTGRQLLANKQLIKDEVVGYLNNNYFTYDGVKCSRDTALILDAVKRDVLTGSNFSSVFAGLAYRAGTSSGDLVITDQLTETVGAITWLKGEIGANLTGTALTRSNTAFDEIIDIMNAGQGNADAITFGTPTVSTGHTNARIALQTNKAFLQAEATAWLAANYPAFTYDVAKCERDVGYLVDSISFDIQHGSNTAAVNNARLYFDNAVSVLPEDQKVITAEVFERIAALAGRIVRGQPVVKTNTNPENADVSVPGGFTPTGGTYDPVTGIMEVTIGAHNFVAGDRVTFGLESITWECGSPAQQISHPRATDPIYDQAVPIRSVTSTSITLDVGDANGYTGAHTFISATADAIKDSALSISQRTQDLFAIVSDMIRGDEFADLPAYEEPTVTAAVAEQEAYEYINGVREKYGFEILTFISETYNGLSYNQAKCSRDVGYIVDAIAQDMEYGGNEATITAVKEYFEAALELSEAYPEKQTRPASTLDTNSNETNYIDYIKSINTLPKDQREPTKQAYLHMADVISDIAQENTVTPSYTQYTPTGATYDPATGVFTATIGSHSLRVGETVYLKDEGITFSCDMGSGQQNHTSPQAHHPFWRKPVTITAVTGTSITMNVGTGGTGQNAHTFISAVANSISEGPYQNVDGIAADATSAQAAKDLVLIIANAIDEYKEPSDLPAISGAPTYEPKRTFARNIIQRNKPFLQEEIVSYINDVFFTFEEGKCARDAGYIVDAIARDILSGGNYNSVYAGRAYRIGTVGADKVVQDQLSETIEGFKFIQRKIENELTGNSLDRSKASFTALFDVLTDGVDAAPAYIFGSANASTSNLNAAQGLIANKTFMQAEVLAWLGVNFASLTYDQNKCYRDVGYMVDAVTYDIRHNTNTGIRDVATLYFENAVSVLPDDQKAPTAAAFVRLAEVAEQLVLKTPVTKSPGNGETQDTVSFGATTAAVGDTVQALFEVVSDVITEDSLRDLPAVLPIDGAAVNSSGYDLEYQIAYNTINDDLKPKIQADIVPFLNEKYNFLEYDEDKCRRDTGYIVDAISHDIQYGGNAAIHGCAEIYFKNAVNVLDRDQREPTRRAFAHLGEVIEKLIKRETVTPSGKNTLVPDLIGLPGANPAKPEIATEARDLAWIISSIADDEDPSNIPQRIDPIITWVDDHFVASKDLIEDNTISLVENMISYISTEYNGLSFPRDKCRRDMGYLVDAVSHDINYQTNHASRISAQIYFENGISVLPVDTRIQTADVYLEMGKLMSDIVLEANTGAGQNFDYDPADGPVALEVKNLIGIVEDVIRADSTAVIPELVEPDLSWVEASKIWAADTIDDNKDMLADDVQEWLREEFTVLDYNKAKCRRDVQQYIIPAFSFDLNYGGNAATRWNADFYYWNNILRLPENQRIPTAKAYRQLGVICEDIVLGKDPEAVAVEEVASAVEGTKVQYLANILYETLLNNDTKRLPALDLPDFDYATDGVHKFSRDVLVAKRRVLQSEVVRFVNSEYNFIDINLTRRDSLNLLYTIANDFRFINTAVTSAPGYGGTEGKGSSKATRTFVASFFNYDGTHVFPVFNPTTRGLNFKGTTTDINNVDTSETKRNDAYIVPTDNNGNRYSGTVYFWNGTIWVNDGANNDQLLYAFYKSWEKMRDYITTNLNGGTDENTMINGLFNDIILGNVLRPNTLQFGSLVESIAHQFNGASAGVNRTALPLNFRNIGLPISALASVLSEDGGRVRWSGADELNNQYFARGLRINGRTGRIEGRPFTSSVRKLARRASNSRAIV